MQSTAAILVLSVFGLFPILGNAQETTGKASSAASVAGNTSAAERSSPMKYVFDSAHFKHYRFPTHTNDLIVDRSQSSASEVFFVVLEPGEAPPRHKHDDTEQVFYITEGKGVLTVGDNDEKYSVKTGDTVRIPFATWHSIRADGGKRMDYFCVDCFGAKGHLKDEPTFDAHVRNMCKQNGWEYDKVTSSTLSNE